MNVLGWSHHGNGPVSIKVSEVIGTGQHSGLDPWGESDHTHAHTYSVRYNHCCHPPPPPSTVSMKWIKGGWAKVQELGQQETSQGSVRTEGLLRRGVQSVVCGCVGDILYISFYTPECFTSIHMGNDGLTKSVLQEVGLHCTFTAAALWMLSSWWGATLTSPSTLFSSHFFMILTLWLWSI